MNVVRDKNTKEIIMGGFADFKGQFDENKYEQVNIDSDIANFTYKKFNDKDELIDMDENEISNVDMAKKEMLDNAKWEELKEIIEKNKIAIKTILGI